MSIGKLHEFNVSNGAWSSYMDRVEMYYKVNKVADELKVPVLIAAMGDEAYELLENLASPKKPADLTLDKIKELMSHHLQPKPSVLAERYRFRQRRQNGGEKVSTYVAELKRLSKHCDFGSELNGNLRDQFVCGLISDLIRQRLFAEDDNITFADAVKLATSLEAAERDAAIVEQTKVTSSSGTGEVQAVMFASRARSGAFSGGQSRAPVVTQQRKLNVNYNGRQERNCEACGARNHNYANCKFRDYVCSKCQRTGHLRRVCPDWGAAPGPAGRGGARAPARRGGAAAAAPTRSAMHFGEADHEPSEDHGGDLEHEFNHLCLNNYPAI
ncbi:uncharacterized protein LOC125241419 [Leguminivora glycinivorella]|uniref:uncharacterized protein LOC125241419 n=1 Tax=Leguminivora glycinivorella TaxID=1035111 RepID=UPI00201079D7|nr:uncharacterized protein LOC125241419 [Leguminivora glycinivorella]